MHRDSDDLKDPIAHVILNVKDMTATVAAIKAVGGSMAGDPRPFGNTGIGIGIHVRYAVPFRVRAALLRTKSPDRTFTDQVASRKSTSLAKHKTTRHQSRRFATY